MKKLLILLLALGLAGGGYWYWRASKGPGTIKVIMTETVARGDVREVLQATGIIKAQVGAEVKIGAQATGRIEQMLVRKGDRVTRGQLVAVIDDRELKADLAEARASLDQQEAELARVRRVYPLQIKEARAEYEATQAQADYAAKTLSRQEELFATGVVSKDALDNAREAHDNAANVAKARSATLERLTAEAEKQTEKARLALVAARARLDALEVRLSHTRIYAAIDGIVAEITAQEGETVVSGLQVTELITLLDPAKLEMWIYVDETDVGRVSQGLPVEYTVDAYPETVFHGEIGQIYPQPEIRDNIVFYQALVAVAPEYTDRLRPEMTTQNKIIVQTAENVLALPNNALKWVDGAQVVFKVTGQAKAEGESPPVEKVTPELGLSGLATTEVLSGIAEGDTVATQIVLPQSGEKKDSGGGSGRGPGQGRGR